jgi:hypothetical protein
MNGWKHNEIVSCRMKDELVINETQKMGKGHALKAESTGLLPT